MPTPDIRALFRDTPLDERAGLLRAIAQHEHAQQQLIERLRAAPGIDQNWVDIARRDLRVGLDDLLHALGMPAY